MTEMTKITIEDHGEKGIWLNVNGVEEELSVMIMKAALADPRLYKILLASIQGASIILKKR